MFKIIGIETIPEYGMMDFLNGLDFYARPYEKWIEQEKQARFDGFKKENTEKHEKEGFVFAKEMENLCY